MQGDPRYSIPEKITDFAIIKALSFLIKKKNKIKLNI